MGLRSAAALMLAVALSSFMPASADAQGSPEAPDALDTTNATGWPADPDDPGNILERIRVRETQRKGLIPFSPIQPIRNGFTAFNRALYDATYLKLGLSFHHVYQNASTVLPDTQDDGDTTDMDLVGTWELFHRGRPTQGELFFGVEGRWDYHTIGPQNIGFVSLASAGGTANSFSGYNPTFIVRNLYYHQGGEAAGWVYRFGRITPDALVLSNRHISPNTTFLPNAGTGVFASSPPDSGFGVAGNWFINERVSLGGVISDSNADRFTLGDPGAGDTYKALELGLKIAPLTDQASYSKFTLWQTDGTKDGLPINGNTGASGWGFGIVAEQELTSDGRAVAIGRYGRSYDKAAIYDQQAAVHFLFYEPTGRFENDVIGTAFNWIDSAASGARDEYNWEVFYRFPLLPDVDTTLSYQAVIDPALTRELDFSSVFSVRLTTSF